MAGFRVVARSHVGVIRNGNEDAGMASNRVLAVADGMGGHAAGEVASSAVIQSLNNSLHNLPSDSTEIERWIIENVNEAHSQVGDLIVEDPNRRGMGTTLSVLIACDDSVVFGHIGDSRIYRLRNQILEQITRDHTYVQTLVDSGEISIEEAAIHPRRNLLMRAIDGIHDVSMDIKTLPAQPGDRFLVCSDGLTGVLGNEKIAEMLSQSDLTYAVSTLIDLTLAGGAPDNVTIVVGEYLTEAPAIENFLVGSADSDLIDQEIQSEKKSRKLWPWLLGLFVFATASVAGFSLWLTNQWYIGTNDSLVVVYQGINQTIGTIELSQEVFRTNIPIIILNEMDLVNVKQGITQPDLKTAQDTVQEILARSPICILDPARCSS